jgi:long-chain acyl-CoA synthetase
MRLVFRLRVEGSKHLPAHGPLLIAPNHASYLDPMAIAAALPWGLLRETYWAGWTKFMFRAWHWRLLSRATRVFPVDPDRGPAAAIEAGEAVLARRHVLIWFPEGRRTLTGEIGPFLPGVGVLLQKSGSPAVPARVTGSFAALPWNRRWPRRVPITVIFGAPMSSDELGAAGEGDNAAERAASGLRRVVLRLGDN